MKIIEQHHLLWRAGFGPNVAKTFDDSISKTQLVQQIFDNSADYSSIQKPTTTIDSFQTFKMMKAEDKKEFIKKSTESILEIAMLWLDKMANDEAQLRERMVFFWHDHFASSDQWDKIVLQQNETLRKHALGSFRDLLKAMCKDALLLRYLDNPKNEKSAPNENFARELLELFTLGEGQYAEQDIKAAARAFTGHAFDADGNYLFRPFLHDYDVKTFLGKTGRWDAEDIIDFILEQEQTAIHITSKIYAYFVHPEKIDTEMVHQLAKDFYQSDYDINKLLKSIFLSEWFYAPENMGVKIKSPIDLLVGLMRQFNIQFKDARTLLILGRTLGQVPFHPPNVAGWPLGKQWIDSGSLLYRMSLPDFLFLGKSIVIPDKILDQVAQAPIPESFNDSASIDFDLKPMVQKIQEINADSQYLRASQLLLQTTTLEKDNTLQKWMLSNSATTEELILNFLRLPEYQLC
jgi:uncharacterized protein (DUF1800 family)